MSATTPPELRHEEFPLFPTFAELGVPSPLVAALAARGVDQPFALQALTIPDVLAGVRCATSGSSLACGEAPAHRLDPPPPTSKRSQP